jgi:hypothetical protein
MELIDNISNLLGESLKATVEPGVKLKIAARKPLRVVFRDDSVKFNVEQIFKLMSPDTEVKAI